MAKWRRLAAVLCIALAGLAAAPSRADQMPATEVLSNWYRLVLELVRHTPTYSPPVASRAFGYIGITAFEAVAGGDGDLVSLSGQLTGLTPPPARDPGARYSEAVVLQAAMAATVADFFANTGPTGQRAMAAMTDALDRAVADGVPPDVLERSVAQGRAVAAHVFDWSASDGGAVIENMGFPLDYALTPGPSHWVPTSTIRQQQLPLLPDWGNNRPFVLADGADCGLPPPPDYSEDPQSQFYKEALEVYETGRALTPDQAAIARFWSDDPMLSSTPPGHWVALTGQLLERENADLARAVEVLALLGIAQSDGALACWNSKYQYDLVRPVTYIRRFIDPKWEQLLITPPFPEYPSGHSSMSGASAEVLTRLFGEDFAFEDDSHADDGLPGHSYSSLWAAAEEAGISRLYGGIHFRAAIEQGLAQGRCVGERVNALRTRQ